MGLPLGVGPWGIPLEPPSEISPEVDVSFCRTSSEKNIVNLFSKALEKLVKLLQKPNIMLPLSSQLSFQIVCCSYRLRMIIKKNNSAKIRLKIEQNPNKTKCDLHLVQKRAQSKHFSKAGCNTKNI